MAKKRKIKALSTAELHAIRAESLKRHNWPIVPGVLDFLSKYAFAEFLVRIICGYGANDKLNIGHITSVFRANGKADDRLLGKLFGSKDYDNKPTARALRNGVLHRKRNGTDLQPQIISNNQSLCDSLDEFISLALSMFKE